MIKKFTSGLLGGFLICMLFISLNARAQGRLSPKSDLSFGASGLQPLGGFGDRFNFGFGLDAHYSYQLNKTLGLSFLTGYSWFSYSQGLDYIGKEDFKDKNYTYIPLRIGLNIAITKFYVESQLGVAMATNGYSSNGLNLAGQVGWQFSPYLDFSVRFENVLFNNDKNSYSPSGSDAGIIGVRLAYHIGNK